MAEPVADDKSASAEAPQPDAPVAPAATKDARAKSSYTLVVLVAIAVTGAGSLMLLASAMRAPATESGRIGSTEPATAEELAVVPTPVAVEPEVESKSSVPTAKWMASANSRKAGFGANMVFELAADGEIDVWRKRIRPVLMVRCAANTTEVFVVTQSPAIIESDTNKHTIKMSFDGGEPVEQMWEHSVDHDALFAPNGGRTMREIAGARRMSFSFAPFNAPPATTTFSVAGFDAHLKNAGRRCRT
jgi:hypothetical protein